MLRYCLFYDAQRPVIPRKSTLIHIYFLIGFRNRMMVFLNWVWAYFTYGLGSRLITGRQRRGWTRKQG